MNRSGPNLTDVLADADLAAVADLMTGHRAVMLVALTGGRSLAASDLASRARISRSLASTHLSRLLDGGLVSVRQEGRQRHYCLAGAHVAEAIEAMLTIAPNRDATSLRESTHGTAIGYARTCYDHLAGTLGVALTDALHHQHIIETVDDAYRLTDSGQLRLEALGLDIEALRHRRRAFARPCLDWTERRPHLAGALGAGLAHRLLELNWLRRRRDSRALHITSIGQQRLRHEFALNLPSPTA